MIATFFLVGGDGELIELKVRAGAGALVVSIEECDDSVVLCYSKKGPLTVNIEHPGGVIEQIGELPVISRK